jgi:hypothetical protein
MNRKSVNLPGLAAFVVFCGAITVGAQDPPSPVKPSSYMDYAAKFEIVDYGGPDRSPAVDEVRKLKNKRYDGQGWVFKNTNPETSGVGKEDELPPPPKVPVEESDLIIVGRVEETTAYLSNDKEGVYTELNICIKEKIKAAPDANGNQDGSCVTADREGGRVRYPNGQIVFYANSNKGVPWTGTEWLFFLRKGGTSPNYEIITAYQNDEGSVHPLDYYFRDSRGTSFSHFLTAVKEKSSARPVSKQP